MATMVIKKTGSQLSSWEYYIEDKKDWERFKNILKVEDGPAILTEKNGKVHLIPNKTSITLLSNKSKEMGSFKGKAILHALVKCNNKTGYMSIKFIGKPAKNTTAKEDIALNTLDSEIKRISGGSKNGITIFVRNRQGQVEHIFENCTGAKTVVGTPKADFSIVSGNKSVCYISHKDGIGAGAYQQYVSITGKGNDGINNSDTVQETINSIIAKYDMIVNDRKRFKKTLSVSKDEDLIMRSIFGPDYGKSFSKDHVHLIGQGNPGLIEPKKLDNKLKVYGSAYELVFSSGWSCSGELEEFKQKGYVPIILARFQTGRKFYCQGKEYKDIRLLIAPEALSSTAQEL